MAARLSPRVADEGVRRESAQPRRRPHRPLPGALARPGHSGRGRRRLLWEFVDAGKVRHVGVSNCNAEQLADFGIAETLQPPYHLFRRGIEADPLPYAHKHDIGVFVYSPLGSGLLTGALTLDTTFETTDWRSKSSAFQGDNLRRNLKIVDELEVFAAQCGLAVSQLAIAWALARPGVHAAIVGARQPRHIEASVAAADVEVTSDDLAEIDRIAADAVQVAGAAPEGIA